MRKAALLGLLFVIILLSSYLFVENMRVVKAETFQEWQVEDGGGSYSESNGVMNITGSTGHYAIFYKSIDPSKNFNFSLQVNAKTLASFAIMLRSSLPFAGSTQGINLEFGARDGGTVLLARWTNSWVWDIFANVKENEWYTLTLSVQKTPFTIAAGAFSENGTQIGSYSASDMTNLSFDDIEYLGFGSTENGGDYLIRRVCSSLWQKTWIVSKDGTADFETIQSAINAASSYDSIIVKEGEYHEHLAISKTLSLLGENQVSTIIDADGANPGSVVIVTANNVSISGFTIQNSRSGGNAIWVDSYNYTIIRNNIIRNNGDGIRILHSHGNLIEGNIVKDNPYTAIGFDWSYDNIVQFNSVFSNFIGVGAGNPSYNNTFLNNTINNNDYGFLVAFYNNTFYLNFISNNSIQASFYNSSYTNFWDRNFWSDYTGNDSNGDGIGDTPYIINANNKDNHPLTSNSIVIPPIEKPSPILDLTCSSLTSATAFQVEINGRLCYSGIGISDIPIAISYSVNAGSSWIDLTSVNSNSNGSFTAVWMPSVTGNYMIRASWIGNNDYSSVNTTVNLAVAPFTVDNVQNVFSVSSNSTVSDLLFNSVSKKLTFTVSGPSGTSGYADVSISKNLIQDITKLKISIDADEVNFTATSNDNYWLLHFSYSHSIHNVTLSLSSESTSTGLPVELVAIVIVVVVVAIIIPVALLKRRQCVSGKTND